MEGGGRGFKLNRKLQPRACQDINEQHCWRRVKHLTRDGCGRYTASCVAPWLNHFTDLPKHNFNESAVTFCVAYVSFDTARTVPLISALEKNVISVEGYGIMTRPCRAAIYCGTHSLFSPKSKHSRMLWRWKVSEQSRAFKVLKMWENVSVWIKQKTNLF